jgi:hypothetical protein
LFWNNGNEVVWAWDENYFLSSFFALESLNAALYLRKRQYVERLDLSELSFRVQTEDLFNELSNDTWSMANKDFKINVRN